MIMKLGQHAGKEILEALGLPTKGARNVKLTLCANFNQATVATVEIERFIDKEELAKLTAIAQKVGISDVSEIRFEPPAENGIRDVSDVSDEYTRFEKVSVK